MSNIPVKLIYVKFIDEIRTCMGPQSIQIIVMQSCRGGPLSLPHHRDCRPEKSRSLPPSGPPPSFAPSAAGGVACGLPTSGSFRIRGYRPPPSRGRARRAIRRLRRDGGERQSADLGIQWFMVQSAIANRMDSPQILPQIICCPV